MPVWSVGCLTEASCSRNVWSDGKKPSVETRWCELSRASSRLPGVAPPLCRKRDDVPTCWNRETVAPSRRLPCARRCLEAYSPADAPWYQRRSQRTTLSRPSKRSPTALGSRRECWTGASGRPNEEAARQVTVAGGSVFSPPRPELTADPPGSAAPPVIEGA